MSTPDHLAEMARVIKNQHRAEHCCRTASNDGWKLKIVPDTVTLLWFRAIWQTPAGGVIPCKPAATKQEALLRACEEIE